jgi:thiamine biosynthesis lipoprotein
MAPVVLHDQFHAMGCATEVLIVDDAGDPGDRRDLRGMAQQMIAHLERCWSRFLPTSDITSLNHADGMPVKVDPATLTLLRSMIDGWTMTNGVFDPTLLAPLVGLGYDASWDDARFVTSLPALTRPRTPLDEIIVDVDASTVCVPRGCTLDAGGIGKGLAADLVVAMLIEAGALGAMVNIGGDLRVRGEAPQPGGWLIGVADPIDDLVAGAHVALLDGGLATSGPAHHAWVGPEQRLVHHLLDPITQLPTPVSYPRSVIEATIIAGTAAWAEVWTKALLIDGPIAAFPRLDELGLGARAVFADGTQTTNVAWHTYERAIATAGPADDTSKGS